MYVPARDNVAKGVQSLTAPAGRYAARPIDSEPLQFIAAKVAGGPDLIESKDRGDLFSLSPAYAMTLDGKNVLARSYYRLHPGDIYDVWPNHPAAQEKGDRNKDLMGIVIGAAHIDGKEIDFKTIQTYLSSDHEKAAHLAAQLTEGQWERVAPQSEQAVAWGELHNVIAASNASALGLDGKINAPSTGGDIVQWHDETGAWYVFDERHAGQDVFYKVEPNGELFTAAASIPGLARSAEAKGGWHRVPDQRDSPRQSRYVQLTAIAGLDVSSGAQAWLDADGNTAVKVPHGGMTLGGIAFPQQGT